MTERVPKTKRRLAFYGGSFDPIHNGHLEIARALSYQFDLDQLIFIPAFHAPHKVRLVPTSAYHRYAMLCLATNLDAELKVSMMEIEVPERPYSVETLTRINSDQPEDEIFFVMGADSWMDIKTWREWERVLSISNHVVVTRPGVDLSIAHVTNEIRSRIVDLRAGADSDGRLVSYTDNINRIFLTDAVNHDISATEIRKKARSNDVTWKKEVPAEVANYVEKYQIYN